MRRYDSGYDLWHSVRVEPGVNRKFRRANVIIISALVFMLLGVFSIAFGQSGHPGTSKTVPSNANHTATPQALRGHRG
jgi:hypothetical protein